MGRAAGFLAAGIVMAGGAGLALPCLAQVPPAAVAPPLQPVELRPGVWMVQGAAALGSPANRNFISNAVFVVTPQGVVVVDALGASVLARELIQAIERITPAPITHVIVTHYHADHIYGLGEFRRRGAHIVAHEAARAYLHSDAAALRLQASREELAPWVDAQTTLEPADRWLQAPWQLVVGGVELQVIPLGPAHTAEDLVVLLPQQGVLVAGDLVFRGRIPFVGQADSRRWVEALDRMLALPATLLVPGHGPASTQAREDLLLTRDYLLHLRKTMGEAARNLEPFEEAYRQADWSRFEHLPLFKAANRINAYNTYLLMEQQPAPDGARGPAAPPGVADRGTVRPPRERP